MKREIVQETPLGMIVACGILKDDLESIRQLAWPVLYLEQGLHLTPRKLHQRIQEAILCQANDRGPVLLLYGFCGGGLAGLKAGKAGLIIPRFHDCMPFFFGSRSRYEKIFKSNPKTFFLPSSWVAARLDPLSIVELYYTPRVGRETAEWCMSQELKHYQRFLFIDSGASDTTSLFQRACENAIFFGKECDRFAGTRDGLTSALLGPRTNEDYIILGHGEEVVQQMF